MRARMMVLEDLTEGPPVAAADRRPEPARNDPEAYQRFLEREHEEIERNRALVGLPPLWTAMPEEGACSPWAPRGG